MKNQTTKSNEVILTELNFMQSMFNEKFERLEKSVAEIGAKMEADYVTKSDLRYELAPIKEKQGKVESATTWAIRLTFGTIIVAILYAVGLSK